MSARHRKARSPDDGFERPPDTLSVGDTKTFFVRDVLTLNHWDDVEARLLVETSGARFWMQTTEYHALRRRGLIDTILPAIVRRTMNETPAGSVAPDRGILSLQESYFGESPDVNQDGRVDVLLLDIEDRYEETGTFVAGFFDPNDLTAHPRSNHRDLLYVDTRPTIVREDSVVTREAAATIAHEYQHLIQAGYEGTERETTFISEGLSEYAEILCGFAPRPSGAYFQNSTRPLLSWNYARPIPDYARASLFIHYLFEQIGARYARELVQSTQTGLSGIRSVLRTAGGPSFEKLFREWGLALWLNDRTVDPAYGYEHPARDDISFGEGASFSSLPGLRVGSLGALSHVPARVPLISTLQLATRSDDRITLATQIQYPDRDGRVDARFGTSERLHARRGRYGSVRLLASNVSMQPDSGRTDVQILARGTRSARSRTIAYDDGEADPFSGNASYFLLEQPGESIALAFGPNQSGWLYGIRADVVFLSEIAGSDVPRDAARAVDVQIRHFEDGRIGEPLTEWQRKSPNRSFGALRAASISLREEYDALNAVHDSFAVVLQSAHPSANSVAVAMDQTENAEAAGPAFHKDATSRPWRSVSTVDVSNGATLEGFRPILRSQMAVAPKRVDASAVDLHFAHAGERVFVQVAAPFPLDSTRAQVTARMPSGRYAEAEPATTSSLPESLDDPSGSITFALPLQVGDSYTVYARVESTNGEVGRKRRCWTAPVRRFAEVGRPSPHPMQDQTQFSVRLREASTVRTTVYDVLGRRVRVSRLHRWSDGPHKLRVNAHSLSSGTYVVRFRIRRERDGRTMRIARKVVKVE